MFIKLCDRDSWWKAIGIASKTDPRRKQFVNHFFTGSDVELAKPEEKKLMDILHTPLFQKEFCNYLIHTSKGTVDFIFKVTMT